MRRHFALPEGCTHVALDKDIRQHGRGGYFYNWDALPHNTLILVAENNGKHLSHCYMKIHGDAEATNNNKVVALSAAVAELAQETAPAITAKMTSAMATNAMMEFHANEKTAVLLNSFSANQSLRQQQLIQQERARTLVADMNDSGLTDFLAEEEEKTRQKRVRREARQRGEE